MHRVYRLDNTSRIRESLDRTIYKWQRLYREDDTLSIRDYTERIIRVGLEIIWIGQ